MPRHPNSFHALRLVAATLVIYAHGYTLGGHGTDPVAYWTGGATSGSIGVFMFFTISGWLVSQSFDADPHLPRFVARRLLRLMPALVVAVIGTALVVGAAMTTLPLAEYFVHPDTYRYLRNVLVFPLRHELPGVFLANPYARMVNGSLWTLGPELFCYLLVAALGAFGLLRRSMLAAGLAAIVLGHHALVVHARSDVELVSMNAILALELLVYFFSGALLWKLRDVVRFHWVAVPLLVLAVALLGRQGYGQVVLFALLPYATLSVALVDSGTAPLFERLGDWSYGTYLWAFPIQQSIVALWPGIPLPAYIVAAVLASWLAGALSWHLVEKHALALKPAAPRRP